VLFRCSLAIVSSIRRVHRRYLGGVTDSPPTGPSAPVRWGVVGASDIADRVMAPAMAETPTATLVAISSRDPDRAAWFARRHLRRASRVDTSAPAPRTYATAAALAEDPDVDVVYIATEVGRHCEDVLAAVAAGRDVLVEKPMARDAPEAQRMVDAAASAGVRLGVCYYKRLNARHRAIRDLIADGALGQIAAASADYSGRVPGTRQVWRRDPTQSGGGPLIDGGSHVVDLLRHLLADEVAEVTAMTGTNVDHGPVEDTASAILRFRGGAIATINAHWSVTDSNDRRTNALRIAGTDGTVETWPLYEKHSRGTTLLATADGERELDIPEESTHVALLEAIAEARREGRPFPVTGEDGVAAARVVDAVYASARSGRTVTL
jgi:predicted dehydrogenase